jgi:hypothetical protein
MELGIPMGIRRGGSGWLGALVLAGVVAGASPARATTLVFAFEGVVTTLTADHGLFGAPGAVKIGQLVTGHFSYEVGPGNPDRVPADPEMGFYTLTDFVVDQAVASSSPPVGVGTRHQPGLPTLPPAPPDPGLDRFSVVAQSDSYPTVSLVLEGPFGSAFVDDALPTSLDLADFPDGAYVRGLVALGIFPAPSIEDVAMLTSLERVPEPGAGLAAGAALVTLGARLRLLSARARAGRQRPSS